MSEELGDTGLKYEDLTDLQRISRVFYEEPHNGFALPLEDGQYGLIYSETAGGWKVVDSDEAPIDIVFPDRWRSLTLLHDYIQKRIHRDKTDGQPDDRAGPSRGWQRCVCPPQASRVLFGGRVDDEIDNDGHRRTTAQAATRESTGGES